MFVVQHVFEAGQDPNLGERGWIRFGTAGGSQNADLIVYDISVVRYIPGARDVVYSLATDPLVQTLPADSFGTSILASPFLTSAGSPEYDFTPSRFGGNAIRMTNRSENWHATDLILPFLGMDFANYTYTLTVSGRIPWGGDAQLGGADSPWSGFVGMDGVEEFTLVLEIDEDVFVGTGERRWLRMQTRGGSQNADLIIDAIEVVRN
jgi:hypothetical protein